VQHEDAAIASISRIEVLGFTGFDQLSEELRQRLGDVVGSMVELDLDEQVIDYAIALRQRRRMSLADAIIAATALAYEMPLVTRNTDHFKDVPGLQLINPFDPG
jgi:toxin FitB